MLAALCVAGPVAHAADYPYQGYFAMAANPDGPSATDPAHCAIGFFRQDRDGAFTGYHVDLEQFKAAKTLRYVVYNRGKCSYDETTDIESCFVSFDTDKQSMGRTFIDAVASRGGDFIKTMGFDDVPAAYAFHARGEKGSGVPISYFRCPFDEAALAKVLSEDISPLDFDTRSTLMDSSNAILATPLAAELMTAVGLKAAE